MTIPPAVLIYGGVAISVLCALVLAIRYAPKLFSVGRTVWSTMRGWAGPQLIPQEINDPQLSAVIELRSLIKRLKEAGATQEQVRAIEDVAWSVIREMHEVLA